jgi:hypothetical protein
MVGCKAVESVAHQLCRGKLLIPTLTSTAQRPDVKGMQVVENLDNKLTWKPIERVTRVRYYALDNVQAMFVLDDSAEQAGETGRGSALWKMHKILAGCITLHRARLVADRGRPESSCWPFRMTADVMLSTCSCQSAFVSWCECEEGINCSDGRRAALSHEVVQCAASVSCGRTGRTRTRKEGSRGAPRRLILYRAGGRGISDTTRVFPV